MAKIPDGLYRAWNDEDTIHAAEYIKEREIARVAINDTDTRLTVLEQTREAIELGNVQQFKITNNDGSAKTSTAASLNDYDLAGKWFIGISQTAASKPTGVTYGLLEVDRNGAEIYQWLTELGSVSNGRTFFRQFTGTVWTPWEDDVDKRITNLNNDLSKKISDLTVQTKLWTGPMGPNPQPYMMDEFNTVVPSKKLSDCRNGWILIWSDMNYDPLGLNTVANNSDFVYSYIPRHASTYSGSTHLFSIPYSLDNDRVYMTGKRLYVHDDKLVGHANNAGVDSDDVCLRYVLEW